MYPAPFNYSRAATLQDAVAALERIGPDAKVIAGGQTLIPLLKLRLVQPVHLVDIGGIAQLKGLCFQGNQIVIGALTTHAASARSTVADSFPIIKDCAIGIADAQVRSMGTVGGSLAECDPSSCWPTLLVALDAKVTCVSPRGRREQLVRTLLRDAYSPALLDFELIESVHVEASALAGHGAFVAFKRAAPAYPTASAALQVSYSGVEIESIRLSLGCMGSTPIAVDAATVAVRGEPLDARAIAKLQHCANEVADPVTDNKGSADYKRSLLKGLIKRACMIVEARRTGASVPKTHTYYG
ncbi:MAG: carbon monoxide dehydrogenase [Betaproteobacteria bacterium]|nr:carbon monoxide dehydrogenase [Betaproteobacteria bacterium]